MTESCRDKEGKRENTEACRIELTALTWCSFSHLYSRDTTGPQVALDEMEKERDVLRLVEKFSLESCTDALSEQAVIIKAF